MPCLISHPHRMWGPSERKKRECFACGRSVRHEMRPRDDAGEALQIHQNSGPFPVQRISHHHLERCSHVKEGVVVVIHGRSPDYTVDPRMPTKPGRNTTGFRRGQAGIILKGRGLVVVRCQEIDGIHRKEEGLGCCLL